MHYIQTCMHARFHTHLFLTYTYIFVCMCCKSPQPYTALLSHSPCLTHPSFLHSPWPRTYTVHVLPRTDPQTHASFPHAPHHTQPFSLSLHSPVACPYTVLDFSKNLRRAKICSRDTTRTMMVCELYQYTMLLCVS